jgi:hypothetical protein
MRDRTRISGSNLGLLAFDEVCRLCFWLMLIIGNKFPYRFPFPGVMFALDRLQKGVVKAALELNGAAPEWLGDLAAAESMLNDKLLRVEHESGMTLTGIPDVVFQMPGGKLGLADFKSAAFRGEDDPLFAKYVVQLGVYEMLLEKTHNKKVSNSGLVYFQAESKAEGADLLRQLTDTGVTVEFSAHWLPVKTDRDQVNELLDEAYILATTDEPPKPGPGCPHCPKLKALNELISGVTQPFADASSLKYLTTSEQEKLRYRMNCRKYSLKTVLKDTLDVLEDARKKDPWSVIGLWDFTDDDVLGER